jgi:integrase
MAKVISDTSISDAQAREFVRTKPDRAVKTCKKITGFQLMKVGEGASWRYRYTDESGKRRIVTVGNYPTMKADEAAQKAMAWRNQRSDPLAEARKRRVAARSAEQISASRTLRVYLDGLYTEYQARKKHNGKHTLDMIRANFANLLDRDMAMIGAADIRAWQTTREKDGLANTTLQRAYGALRTLLRHAVKEDKVLDSNPIADLKLRAPTAEETARANSADARAHRRMLTVDELAGLNKGIHLFAEELCEQRRSSRKHGRAYLPDLDLLTYPHWFIPFFHLGMHTGMRPGDLYTLTWQELNLNFRRLVKMPEKTLHHRNPAKLDLPVTDALYSVMAPWHAQQGHPAVGLVFPSTSKKKKAADKEGNGKPFGKQAHDAPWARVIALGGVDPNLHFYSLRHHFISALVAKGAPLLAVAKLVGHKSTAMIEKHYGHLAKNAAADLMQTFSEALEAGSAPIRGAA